MFVFILKSIYNYWYGCNVIMQKLKIHLPFFNLPQIKSCGLEYSETLMVG